MEAWFRTFPSQGRGYATRPRQAGPNIVFLTAYYSVADPDPHYFGSRIRLKVEIQELWMLKMEPWIVVDARNGGVEAQNGAMEVR